MYIRTTKYPRSLRSISGLRTLSTNTSGRHGYSYPNPLRARKRLWLFFRGGNFQPNYTVRVPGRWTAHERSRGGRESAVPTATSTSTDRTPSTTPTAGTSTRR